MATLKPDETQPQKKSLGAVLLGGAVLLVCAYAEGVVFQRSRIIYPEPFFDQFIFRTFAVMKMFLAALGMSMLVQAGFSAHNPAAFDASRFYKHNHRGYLRVLAGCFLVGSGMALAGSGPTMLPSAVGAWVNNTWIVAVGGLAGVLVFALLDTVVPLTPRECPVDPGGIEMAERGGVEPPVKKTGFLAMRVLEDIPMLSGYSYTKLAAGLGAAMLLAALAFEIAFPFYDEVDKYDKGPYRMKDGWPPSLAGLMVGAAQVPLRIVTGDGQGGSTAFHNVVATLTCGLIPGTRKYVLDGVDKWWQTIYTWGGTLLGSLSAAHMYNEFDLGSSSLDLVSLPRGFAGGFLMIFGARLAGGCTCGHGISGFSELSIPSIFGTGAVFGGAIGTALVVKCVTDWC